MREQTADHGLRRAHQLFIGDVQHLAGEHRIPMIHDGQILPIVAAETLEVVGERLSGGETLFEAAEARIHRVTSHVDDGRPRQHGVNQADMHEVVGQLVDEARPALA